MFFVNALFPFHRPLPPGEIFKFMEPFRDIAAWGPDFHACSMKKCLFAAAPPHSCWNVLSKSLGG
jgi:hypothetical protein